MAFILGFDAKLYYALNGVSGGTFIELTNCRDVTIALESGESDVTTRASLGFREMVPTLHSGAIDFEMVADPTDQGYIDFKTAWLARQILGIRFLDKVQPDGSGFEGDYCIFKFSRAEPVDGVQMISVSIKPTRGTTHIQQVA